LFCGRYGWQSCFFISIKTIKNTFSICYENFNLSPNEGTSSNRQKEILGNYKFSIRAHKRKILKFEPEDRMASARASFEAAADMPRPLRMYEGDFFIEE
jgi:hypothetical protein